MSWHWHLHACSWHHWRINQMIGHLFVVKHPEYFHNMWGTSHSVNKLILITSFFGRLTYIETLWNLWNEAWIDLVPHSGTQWKCLVPDTPSFYDHIWIFKHKMALCALQCVIGYVTSLYLVMKQAINNRESKTYLQYQGWRFIMHTSQFFCHYRMIFEKYAFIISGGFIILPKGITEWRTF